MAPNRDELLAMLAETEQLVSEAKAALAESAGDALAKQKATALLRQRQRTDLEIQRLLNEGPSGAVTPPS